MRHKGQAALIFVALTAASGIALFPVLWMLLTALRPPAETFARTLNLIPSHLTWSNFARTWNTYDVSDWFLNSLVIAILGGALAVLVDLLAGYAFAKFEFPGRDVLFILLLATMMIPVQVYMVPQFMTVAALGAESIHSGRLFCPRLPNPTASFWRVSFSAACRTNY